jgi:hypothetical protein
VIAGNSPGPAGEGFMLWVQKCMFCDCNALGNLGLMPGSVNESVDRWGVAVVTSGCWTFRGRRCAKEDHLLGTENQFCSNL